jgi:hypothetical protein
MDLEGMRETAKNMKRCNKCGSENIEEKTEINGCSCGEETTIFYQCADCKDMFVRYGFRYR